VKEALGNLIAEGVNKDKIILGLQVVLPASGWDIIAKLLLLLTSLKKDEFALVIIVPLLYPLIYYSNSIPFILST